MSSVRPTHTLYLVSREVKANGKRRYTPAGAAWATENGTFNIQLNVGITIDWRMQEEVYINLVSNGPTDQPNNTSHSDGKIPF